MTWWIWRQHRSQLLAAAGLLAALAVWMGITGIGLAHQFRDIGIPACLRGGGDCGSLTDQFLNLHHGLSNVAAVLLALPGLIGVFWGAPLVARELESGTHRLAWTQSVTRRRWLSFQLGLLGAATVVLSALFAWLVTWWSQPLAVAGHNRFNPGIFDLRGIVPIFYALFAFALGVAVGSVLRRTVAAMGVTLLGYGAVRVAVEFLARPHFLKPVTVSLPFGTTDPRLNLADWTLTSHWVDRAGNLLGRNGGIDLRLTGGACPAPTTLGNLKRGMESCLNSVGARMVSTIQPYNRYWTFQLIESAIFACLAIALAVFTVRWVRRRIT